MMNLRRLESQLADLDRLVPYVTEHGCDVSAQDAARALMRAFDHADPAQEDQRLGSAYASLRDRLKEIAEGRSGSLPVGHVAAFSRLYREHMLRETGLLPPIALRRLDS